MADMLKASTGKHISHSRNGLHNASIINKCVATQVIAARKEARMSRPKLARAVGLTERILCRIEYYERPIRVGELVLLAEALNKPIAYFYEGVSFNRKLGKPPKKKAPPPQSEGASKVQKAA